MTLLQWAKEPKKNPSIPPLWEIPIKYQRYGTIQVLAWSKDEALSIWEDLDGEDVETRATWDHDEIEIDWCGNIGPVDVSN